jgi:hypothetical protein
LQETAHHRVGLEADEEPVGAAYATQDQEAVRPRRHPRAQADPLPGRNRRTHSWRLDGISYGNALDRVPDSYKRYLEGFFRNKFELIGTPMAIEFRTGRNPYAGKAQKKRR